MKRLIMLLVIAGACGISPLFAQTGSSSQPDTATLNFITQATIGGMKEIKSGKLAIQNGKETSVKTFGAKMIADHGKANTRLMQIVRSKGWNVTPPSDTQTAADAMLTGAKGTAFDKNYVSMMVADHQKTVALFQNYAANGTDTQVKAFAVKTLPVLNQHLASIKSIASKMNITTTSM